MSKSFREISRRNWTPSAGTCTERSTIQLGAILRIADATEVMAKNYRLLQESCDRYKRYYHDERESSRRLWRSNCALRGVITRLKNRLDNAWECRR